MRLAETYLVIIKIYKHLKRTEEKILEPNAERGRINHCFLIGVQLPSNVVLVSAIQQSESGNCIHMSTLFRIFSPFRSPQSTEQSSLGYTVSFHQLSILYIVLYICQSQFPNSSYPSIPTLVSIHLFSISVYLFLQKLAL